GCVFIEATPPAKTPLFLYGAGHVGRALAPILVTLPIDLYWVDDAEDRFPELRPDAADCVLAKQPTLIAKAAPLGAIHLVMTYAHDVDFAICHAALAGGQAGFVGLIGSATKRARFEKRLLDAGLPTDVVGRLVCPIGLTALTGKTPAVIAIGVAAQIAAFLETAT
ncbi:MAG: xanthine dehydrogenase accessory protein XdhC, partial [Pseudomonadota bacterium]